MRNKLNDLSGREWLFWTSTIYQTSFPPDATHHLRKAHGAMKPPELMAEIIRFFTKESALVLDPFAGVGGTLLGAALAGRASLGFELNPAWVEIYRRIQAEFVVADGHLAKRAEAADGAPIEGRLECGDCLGLLTGLPAGSVDLIATDPPYGCDHGATGFKNETNFAMRGGERTGDFGDAADLDAYLDLMGRFGEEARRVLADEHYLVMLIGDRYRQGEYVPLGTMVAETLRRAGFKFKGLRLWWNQATQRPLKPYALGSAFVPNINHQNLLVMQRR